MKADTIILVRHAESAPDFSRPEADWPLSPRGIEQAEQLAIADRIDRICSSPYLRAIDTVRPLAREIGIPIEICEDLRERKLSEGPIPDFIEVIERSWRDFDLALPGCESARQAQLRAVVTIERLAEQSRGNLLISSHGQLIALFLNAIDPSFRFEQWRTMSNPHVFRIIMCDGRLQRADG